MADKYKFALAIVAFVVGLVLTVCGVVGIILENIR